MSWKSEKQETSELKGKINRLEKEVNDKIPSHEDFTKEYNRRNECEFPHPKMNAKEAYLIGFSQCYRWAKYEIEKLKTNE